MGERYGGPVGELWGEDLLRAVVAAHLPGQRVDAVSVLGEGLDSVVYELDGELLVRCSKEADRERRVAQVHREARLLAAVAGVSPLPVPQVLFTVPERGWLAYRKLPGVPLLDVPESARTAHATTVATRLGELLGALHDVPVERMATLVDTDDQPLAQWHTEAAETYATVADTVPVAHRRAVEAFLAAPPPRARYIPVFSHSDLGIEHVLVNPVTCGVTGIIDWSDAAITDPAGDFGRLYRDLGPAALDTAMASYRTDGNDAVRLRERAVFYARCGLMEDLAYGIESGRGRYVDKSLAAMAWLFPQDR
jgi:aminoglycoside phosphotransferase (APT) family kinase protein